MTLPTGPGSHYVLPGVSYLYGWDLNDTWSIGGSTLGEAAVDDDDVQYLELGQSLTVGCSITEVVGAYAEWFALMPAWSQTELPQQYFNGGFTFLVNNNLQFDVRAGTGLNAAADNFFTGGGAVIRR
ncbi:MAG: transporter [Planctomycetes bacterium]|nr:transporter [Planctomycetota bacterium]